MRLVVTLVDAMLMAYAGQFDPGAGAGAGDVDVDDKDTSDAN